VVEHFSYSGFPGSHFGLETSYKGKGKAKISLYRPWRRLGLREVEAPTFSDIRLTDGGKVVSPTRRQLFTPRKIPGTHFCYRLSRPQGHSAVGRKPVILTEFSCCHLFGICVTYKTSFGFNNRIYWTFIQLVITFHKSLSSTGHSRLLTTLH
jgi:hypothetical protein